MVTSTQARAYKQEVALLAKLAGIRQPLEGPVRIRVAFHPRQNKDGTPNQNRLDLDNSQKIAIDALNGVAWLDDWQIVEIVTVLAEPCPGGGLTVKIAQNKGE